MRDLSQSDLQLVSGGLSAVTMPLAAGTAVAGYIGSQCYAYPDPYGPRNGATATGASWAAIGCGLATLPIWTSPRLSPYKQLEMGTAASVLCGAVVGTIGEKLSSSRYLDDDWPYV